MPNNLTAPLSSSPVPQATPAAVIHVAYLVNQYPLVSHTFIRREIAALERHGARVERISIRGWDAEIVDPADLMERERTWFVLKDGLIPLFISTFQVFFSRPRLFTAALSGSIAMARKSERNIIYHLVYLAQACRIFLRLRKTGVGHVHAHFGTNPAEVAMLVRLLGGPTYSYTAHGPEENDRGAFIGIDKKVKHAKFVVAISSHTKSQLLRRITIEDWHKVKIVHCGIDAEFHMEAAELSPSGQGLVCVARLDSEKGQLILLKAMQDISKKFPRCRLILVGDGENRSVIEVQIRALGLSKQVSLLGWLTSAQVRREILRARALVLPSFQEGLPVVIMEAMALGRPVIATYVAGVPELVRNGKDGWLVPAGDSEQLAKAIEACLIKSDFEISRMGEEARLRVLDRHNIDRETAKLVDYFGDDSDSEQAPKWE
jgi:colanic acid/amylovoran biosynthesis glycosyltransferase